MFCILFVQRLVFSRDLKIVFFHPIEMVILALLNDDNKKNRQKGFNFIKQYRDNKQPDDTIRKIQKYNENQINLLCTNYTNFIKYDNVEITEPPATFHISLEELQDIVDGKQIT